MMADNLRPLHERLVAALLISSGRSFLSQEKCGIPGDVLEDIGEWFAKSPNRYRCAVAHNMVLKITW